MHDAERHAAALGQLLELVLLLDDDMTTSLEREGLTVARARLLWHLQQLGPSPQRVLADAMGVSPRNVTGLVDALTATGFVTRQQHPTDRRATLVTFTKQGAGKVAEMGEGRAQLAELLFAGMSDRQFDGFVRGLGAVLERLRGALAGTGEAREGIA